MSREVPLRKDDKDVVIDDAMMLSDLQEDLHIYLQHRPNAYKLSDFSTEQIGKILEGKVSAMAVLQFAEKLEDLDQLLAIDYKDCGILFVVGIELHSFSFGEFSTYVVEEVKRYVGMAKRIPENDYSHLRELVEDVQKYVGSFGFVGCPSRDGKTLSYYLLDKHFNAVHIVSTGVDPVMGQLIYGPSGSIFRTIHESMTSDFDRSKMMEPSSTTVTTASHTDASDDQRKTGTPFNTSTKAIIDFVQDRPLRIVGFLFLLCSLRLDKEHAKYFKLGSKKTFYYSSFSLSDFQGSSLFERKPPSLAETARTEDPEKLVNDNSTMEDKLIKLKTNLLEIGTYPKSTMKGGLVLFLDEFSQNTKENQMSWSDLIIFRNLLRYLGIPTVLMGTDASAHNVLDSISNESSCDPSSDRPRAIVAVKTAKYEIYDPEIEEEDPLVEAFLTSQIEYELGETQTPPIVPPNFAIKTSLSNFNHFARCWRNNNSPQLKPIVDWIVSKPTIRAYFLENFYLLS